MKWNLERTRRLEGSRPFDHACLERRGGAIHVVGQEVYRMVEDSLQPVQPVEEGGEGDEGEGEWI